jgi:DNA (cytosine-5)-methyltransferase 1
MPLLLDLFCCEGGAGTGYNRAGFEVVGVDLDPQPLYPFTFHQGDALTILRDLLLSDIVGDPVKLTGREYVLQDFDAIHASPPCQAYSTITPDKSKHPDLIGPVRELLVESGLPYVIENVAGARRELIDPMMLCGSSFGLRVRRHRFFESNVFLSSLPCNHAQQGEPVGVYGQHGDLGEVRRPNGSSRGRKARDLNDARDAMGMPWASWRGCAEAVPPAFTEWIGAQLLDEMEVAA